MSSNYATRKKTDHKSKTAVKRRLKKNRVNHECGAIGITAPGFSVGKDLEDASKECTSKHTTKRKIAAPLYNENQIF
jgi:hypothetical protein